MPIPQQWAPDLLQAALDAGQIQVARHRPGARAPLRADVQVRHLRPAARADADRLRRRWRDGPRDRRSGRPSCCRTTGPCRSRTMVRNVVVIGKASQVYAQQAVAGGARVGQPFGSGGGSSDVVPIYSVARSRASSNVLTDLGNTTAQVRLILVDDANQTATIDGQSVPFAAALAEAPRRGRRRGHGRHDRRGRSRPRHLRRHDGEDARRHRRRPRLVRRPIRRRSRPSRDRNPAKNSNTVAMIKAVMGAGPSMAEKTALVLKDNAGVAMDPALVGQARAPPSSRRGSPARRTATSSPTCCSAWSTRRASPRSPTPSSGKGFLDHASSDSSSPATSVNGAQTVEYTEG